MSLKKSDEMLLEILLYFAYIIAFLIFIVLPLYIGFVEIKLTLSDKIQYKEIGVIESKELKVEKKPDFPPENKYYVTIAYQDSHKTFDSYDLYSKVQVGDELDIYVVEFWLKNELYRLDFHYRKE